jgi:methionyl-tRNA formyltransferase
VSGKAYAVATVKPWNVTAYHRHAPSLPGRWQLIDRPEDLSAERLLAMRPRYLFFPHWSWKVPAEILEAVECVCFHMTDVPYGRGGSPLQNLIARGHTATMLTALRMTAEMDGGPVYLKRPLDLSGRAQEIFARAADLTFAMIAEMVAGEPEPVAQAGEVTVFRRRRPEQSRLPEAADLAGLYDHIRMLDAETYPQAFLESGHLRLTFSHAELGEGTLTARVTISRKGAGDGGGGPE